MRLSRFNTKSSILHVSVAAMAVLWAVPTSAQQQLVANSTATAKTVSAAETARASLRAGEDALRALDYNRAISALSKALAGDALEPRERAIGLLNRGLARQNNRKFKGAVEDYTNALGVGTLPSSGQAIAHFNRGLAHNSLAQTTLALDDLSAAIRINSAFAQAYNSRATLMRMLGRHGAAIKDYQLAVKYRYPKPHLAYYGEALSYLKLRQTNLARIALTNAVSANPNFALARTKLDELNKSLRAESTVVAPAAQEDQKIAATSRATDKITTQSIDTNTGVEIPQTTRMAPRAPTKIVPSKIVSPKIVRPKSAQSKSPPRKIVAVRPAAAKPPVEQQDVPLKKPVLYDGYLVQLMAQRRPGPLKDTWNRISERHAAILGDLKPIIEKADLGERGTMYRLKTGPFESRGGADRMCDALKKRGLDCFSIKAR